MPPLHRILLKSLDAVAEGRLPIDGDEAHHAVNVRRLRPGEPVEVLDGRGRVLVGRVGEVERAGRRGTSLTVEIERDERREPVRPRLTVCSAVPKGARLEEMIDQLSQIGAAAWRPLLTARGERTAFRADKLERVAEEAAKQCGRAWVLEIGDPVEPEAAARLLGVVVADASGEPGADLGVEPAEGEATLLVGPEGGFSDDEFALLDGLDVRRARFGPHVMRIETAAVAGAACLLRSAR